MAKYYETSKKVFGIGGKRSSVSIKGILSFIIVLKFCWLKAVWAEPIDNDRVLDLVSTEQYDKLNEYLWTVEERSPVARFLLAMSIYHGMGIHEDHAASAELLSEAWIDGFAEAGAAYCILIVREKFGIDEYASCLLNVAETGNPSAKEALAGLLMFNKDELPATLRKRDHVQLLEEAFQGGSGSAAFSLFLLSNGTDAEAIYTPDHISYLKQAANSFWLGTFYGNQTMQDTANMYLAFAYLKGNGVAASISKYIQHLEASYALGNADAACRLGQAYTIGAGVVQNLNEAARYLKVGKKRGCRDLSLYLSALSDLGNKIEDFDNFTPPTPSVQITAFDIPQNNSPFSQTTSRRKVFEGYNQTLFSTTIKRRSIQVFGTPGISCRGFGSITNCSDGTYYQHVGNFAFGSNGSSYQKIGNFYYSDRGVSYQTIGRSTYGSDGTYCRTYGSITSCF